MKVSTIGTFLLVATVAFFLGIRVGSGTDPYRPTYGDAALASFAEILRIEAPAPRAIALAHFFEDASPVDVEGLRDVMRVEHTHVDAVAEVLFASWWARFDPSTALLRRFPTPRTGRHPWVRAVFSTWTTIDPTAALAAAVAMPADPSAGRLEASLAVARNWFQAPGTDPTPLLGAIMLEAGSPRERAALTDALLISMMEVDGEQAVMEYVRSLDQGVVGAELSKRLTLQLYYDDPQRAVEWALEEVDIHPRGWGPLVHLAATWGWQDGASAMEWAASLPESEYREKVVDRAFRSWLGVGLDGQNAGDDARAWMAEATLTPSLEAAWVLYAGNVARTDPAKGASLALQLENEPHRTEALTAVASRWLRQDRAAALAWIEETGLGATLREEILRAQRRDRATPQKKR